ncbi:hypothetical protein HYALB_00009667 [Hymenoscyphus albidus]|uniref:Zn(2)-C6 fungal-type domain-containing protein n=1 Tax=Hymenoscyphus albidus TaxID=595503 RepID=A0A9N9LE90_9HELO|nr:hypothetical protein HYALB_00009667 [Hymenoscyphus albidus]
MSASRPRRSHKKSKAGCQRCKLRKIKCDEIHPVCGNCAKHGVSCDFEGSSINPNSHSPVNNSPITANGFFAHRKTSSASPNSATSVSSSAKSPLANSLTMYQTPATLIRPNTNQASSRLLELKLMHHYTARTAYTFADTDDATLAWQEAVPSIAYNAGYLMDAILAVSALHLRLIEPNDRALVRASHSYMAASLAQYSSLLTNGASQINAEALFSTAALIAFQASALRIYEGMDNHRYTVPLAWFHSFQGVKTIVLTSWQWLRNSRRIFPIINSQPALSLNLKPDSRSFFAPLLEGMDAQLETLPAHLVELTRGAYEHSVAFLNWGFENPVRHRILSFPATVSRRFIEMVTDQDPRSLVIVACFFALTKPVDDVWWLQGVAKREVNGIMTILPPEWRPKMEWALKIANHEGTMDEKTWGTSLHPEGTMVGEPLSFDQTFLDEIVVMTQIIDTYSPQD